MLVVTTPSLRSGVALQPRARPRARLRGQGHRPDRARIRAIVHENEILVTKGRWLARARHATVVVDDGTPEARWTAVAELVGFVVDLRCKIRRASLRED